MAIDDVAARVLADEVGVITGTRVCDLAAGTGKLTRRLVELGASVVTVAQAFHWFDAPAALTEIARVLRPGGALAILWNERGESSAWVAEMSRIIRWHERTVSRYQHVSWPDIVAESRRFTPLDERAIGWDQPMTREVLAARVRSISYIAVLPPTERERLAAEVTTLVARLAEPFGLPYICRVQWCCSTDA